MKVMTQTIKSIKARTLTVLLLAVLLSVAAMPAYAVADEEYEAGPYSLSGKFDPNGVELSEEVTFKLYKVGNYTRDDEDKAIIELYDKYPVDLGDIDINNIDFSDEDAALQQLAKAAETVEAYVVANEVEPVKTAQTSGADHSFTMSGLSNGLYLITGSSQEVTGYDAEGNASAGATSTWWPQPVLFTVLDCDIEMQTKIKSEYNVKSFKVIKKWAGDEAVSDIVRPESVEIEVYYKDGDADAELIYPADDDKLELNSDNNWTFSWEDTEGRSNPANWYVVEKLSDETKQYYKVEEQSTVVADADVDAADSDGATKIIYVTNTYSPKRLYLTKELDGYVGENTQNVTLAFKIVGKDADGNEVYVTNAGVNYSRAEADPLTKTIEIKNIPANVASVTVTETYSGNYKASAEQTESYGTRSVIEVAMTGANKNTHTTNNPGSGSVNKYQGKSFINKELETVTKTVEKVIDGAQNSGDEGGNDTPDNPEQE